MKRAAAISMAALLTVGGAATMMATTAGAVVNDPSTTSTTLDSTTPTTESTVPAITEFSITLAGLGDISLSLDPVTQEISNILVTPLDGITVADPIAVHNGIQLDFTLADGTVKSIVVEVEGHHGQIRIEVEDPESEDDELDEDDEDRGDGPPPIEDRGVSSEHRNDDHDRHGPWATTPPTTSLGASGASAAKNRVAHSDSSDREESESDSSRGDRSGRSGDRD